MFKKLFFVFVFVFFAFNSIYCQLSVTATITSPVTCSQNGSIAVTASGGTPSYTYSINGSTYQPNNVFTGLTSGTYVLTVRDQINNTASITYTISPVIPPTAIVMINSVSCSGYNDGVITINTTGGVPPFTYTLTGSIINGSQVNNVFSGLPAGMYTVQIEDMFGCKTLSNAVVMEPTVLVSTTTTSNDIIEVTTFGGTPPYEYSLDNIFFNTPNVFIGLEPGSYNIYTRDSNWCYTISNQVLKPIEPVIDNPEQTFPQGATLESIDIEGQNIRWYATQSGNKMASSELPLSTVLVDATTYYASQTVNGVESEKRGITVKVGALSNDDFAFQNLKVYPIPAKEILKVNNVAVIKKAVVFNYLGGEVLSQSIDKTNFEINLSALDKGVYFVKLESQDGQKTIKFIKE